MKKLLLLVALSMIGALMCASVASAQSVGNSASASGSASATVCNADIAPGCGKDLFIASPFPVLPRTGGLAILLPAAVLLPGSGILTYAILRRR